MGDCLLSHRRGTARGDVRDLIRYTLTVASQRIAAVNATSDRPKSFAAAVPSSVPHNGECRYALGHLLVNQESNAARRSSEQPAPVAELVEPAEATSVSGQAASLLGSLPNIIFFSIWTAAYPPLIPPCGTPHTYVHGRAARCGALLHDEPALEPFQCANHRLFTAVRCAQCASYSWDGHYRHSLWRCRTASLLCFSAARVLCFGGLLDSMDCARRRTVADWQAEIIDPIMPVTNSSDPFNRQ